MARPVIARHKREHEEEEDEEEEDGHSTEIKVFTLNCWGLKMVSDKRRERMAAIGAYLARSNYDIVTLQEVWMGEDFQTIRDAVRGALPYSHFFDNGIIGSGTCVFTRAQIRDATFHEFTMNGYPHKIWHGDWFGGKGLGVCQINYRGFDIHVYTSHYHAEYDRDHDVYLGHRVIHALESAQWIKLASSSADITLYSGDFNTEPTDVPYKMVRAIAPLQDAWRAVHGEEGPGGETCETPANSFSAPASLSDWPQGKRIDYIMYAAGPNVRARAVTCELPLPSRVPGKMYSYSDHEAVTATIRLTRTKKQRHQTVPEYCRETSLRCRDPCLDAVNEALEIIRRSQDYVDKDGLRYALVAALLLILLVASFIPLVLLDPPYHALLEVGLFFPRFVITVGLMFFFLMATLFNKKERNALSSAKVSLQLIRDQDFVGPHDCDVGDEEANGGNARGERPRRKLS